MANVPNGVETLPKISIAWVGCMNNERYIQTDRRAMTYNERKREFMFA